MDNSQRDALLSISLMAAYADGGKDPREIEALARVAQQLSVNESDLRALNQDALARRRGLSEVTAPLQESEELRQQAYELAVAVCNADGAQSAAEQDFLNRLATTLAIAPDAAERFASKGAQMAVTPLAETSAVEPPIATTLSDAEMDQMILNYAILNGALELLPQTLASMAIIPLQMRMVYRVGKAHGYELDSGHIKDFLATVGIGLTSQYVEQYGRKLIGGLLGRLAGGIGRSIGSTVTGSAFSFGTTYALGHMAKRYYAGGRTFSTDALKTGFTSLLGEAQAMKDRYLPEMQRKASTLDVGEVLKSVRG